MKKAECEAAIRQLAREWASAQEQPASWHPNFYEFQRWLDACGYGRYLQFRSVMPAIDEAERWFSDELKPRRRS